MKGTFIYKPTVLRVFEKIFYTLFMHGGMVGGMGDTKTEVYLALLD